MQTTKSKIMKVQQKVKKQTRFECCLRTDFYMLICETQAFIPPAQLKSKDGACDLLNDAIFSQWPWITHNLDFKGMPLFSIEYLWNGTR